MIHNKGLLRKQKSEISKEAAHQQWNPVKTHKNILMSGTPNQKEKYRTVAEKQKETEGSNYSKILRIAAIAGQKHQNMDGHPCHIESDARKIQKRQKLHRN